MKFGGNLTKMVNFSYMTWARKCLLIAALLIFSVQGIQAAEFQPYKISLTRTEADKPIRKSAIMAAVRNRWPGQILHIRSDTDGGQDCHIVKSMGDDGEFRIIHVSCND